MGETNIFQMVLIGVIIVIVFVAIGIFTGVLPGFRGGAGATTGETSIWVPESIADILNELVNQDFDAQFSDIKVAMEFVPDNAYESRVINALASGSAPEVWFLPHTLLARHEDKLGLIPFSSITEKKFLDSFVDAGAVFLKPKAGENGNEGILGIPVAIDPLVLYLNRDLLSATGIASPAKTWDEFMNHAQKLTKTDSSGNITQAGAAMGEFNNIKHAKDLLVMFILQSGNPIVTRENGSLASLLDKQLDLPISPAASAIRFFNEFSNPRKTIYTWNYSFPEAQNSFAAQKLAMYIGYASEYREIARQNPHLNFFVSEVPQVRDGRIQATYGKLTTLVISKRAIQSSAALQLATFLASPAAQQKMQDKFDMPSVRRDTAQSLNQSAKLAVFTQSAIKTRVWLDPDPDKTYEIFKNMVQSVKIGQKELNEAVKNASMQIQNVISGI